MLNIFRKLLKKKRSEIREDKSYLANEVLSIISSLNIEIYPMFGTLLSIYRDKEFRYADDFDFAVDNKEKIDLNTINELASKNVLLKSYSIVDKDLTEISFIYKDVTVDIFIIPIVNGRSLHKCPNFRTEKPSKRKEKGLKFRHYKQSFHVSYEAIELIRNEAISLLQPRKPVDIFENHYGDDWETPKLKDFIDFKKYSFVNEDSYIVYGKHEDILKRLKEIYLSK